MKDGTCKNGHPNSERVYSGGRWRCPKCRAMHDRRDREREKAYRAQYGHRKKPICPRGCITVCLCEEL